MASFWESFSAPIAQMIIQKHQEKQQQKAVDDILNAFKATKIATQPGTADNLNNLTGQADIMSKLAALKQRYETTAADPNADQSVLGSLSTEANSLRDLYKSKYSADLPGAETTYQSMAPQVTDLTSQRDKTAQNLLAASKSLYGNRFTEGDPLTNAQSFLTAANQDFSDPTFARAKLQNMLAAKYGGAAAGKAADQYDTLTRNEALSGFMRNPNMETAAAAMRAGIDVTKLSGLTPQTSLYDVNTNKAAKTYAVKKQPFGGPVTRNLIGEDAMGLTPGQQQQGQQFEQSLTFDKQKYADNLALNKQELGLKRQALERDWSERDRRFNLDVQKIGNDNVKQYVVGQHDQLRSLNSDAASYLKMAENEIDPNKKAEYFQAAQGLLSQANQVRGNIDKIVSSWVPGTGSQTSSAQQDPVGKMIDDAKAAGYKKQQILDHLHQKGIYDYDSWVW